MQTRATRRSQDMAGQLALVLTVNQEERIQTMEAQTEPRAWLANIERAVERVLERRPGLLETTVEFVGTSITRPAETVARARELLRQAHAAESLDERLDAIIRLKNALGEAVAEARRSGPRPFKHGLVTVRETVESAYAEDLTDEQFLALEEVLARLQDADLDKEDVLNIAKCLRESGLRPIPLLTREQHEKALESLGL